MLRYYDFVFNINNVVLGDSTDDDDASDSCEFFDAQGGDSFDVTTKPYLVNRQSPNILQHKSLSSTQVFIFLTVLCMYEK